MASLEGKPLPIARDDRYDPAPSSRGEKASDGIGLLRVIRRVIEETVVDRAPACTRRMTTASMACSGVSDPGTSVAVKPSSWAMKPLIGRKATSNGQCRLSIAYHWPCQIVSPQ